MLRNTCSLVSGCGNLSSSESVDGSISSLRLSPCNDSDSSKLVATECVLQKHGLLGCTAVNVWQEEANMWKSHLKFRDTTTLLGSLWEFSLLFVLKMLEKNIPCASRWWHLFKLWKNHDQEFTKKNQTLNFQAFNVYVHYYIFSVSIPWNIDFHHEEVWLPLLIWEKGTLGANQANILKFTTK